METASSYSDDSASDLPNSDSEYLSSIAEQQDEALAAVRLLQQMGGGSTLRTSQKQTGSIASSVMPTHSLGFSFVNEPDLTYYCGLCQTYINLTCMKDHKAFHLALTTLQYSESRMPKDVVELGTRRRFLIKLLVQQQKTADDAQRLRFINGIDEAYELLKQDLEDTFEQYRKVNEKVSCAVTGRGLSCSLDAVKAIGVCGSTNDRWKSENEDASVFQDHFGNDAHKAFLAIYDGHNGRYAAAMAANELHYILLNRMCELDPNARCVCAFNMLEQNDVPHYLGRPWPTLDDPVAPGIVHRESVNDVHQVLYHCADIPVASGTANAQLTNKVPGNQDGGDIGKDAYGHRLLRAIRDAYRQTDLILSYGKDEKSRVRWSGASALTLVLIDKDRDSTSTKHVAANAAASDDGRHEASDDSDVIAHVFLGNAGNVQAVLVQDDGMQVISKKHTGANRKERARVEAAGGFFSDSDRELRVNGVLSSTRGLGNHGDPRLKRCTSCEPHLKQVKVTSQTQFMILASNGVWEVFTPQEATDILLQFYQRVRKMLPANRIPTPGDVSPSILKLLQNRIGQAKQRSRDNTSASADAAGSEGPAAGGSAPTDRKTTAHVGGGVKWQLGSPAESSPARPSDDVTASVEPSASDVDGARANRDASIQPAAADDEPAYLSAGYDHKALAKDMAERLCQAALLAGSKDNITVMVVLFPAVRI